MGQFSLLLRAKVDLVQIRNYVTEHGSAQRADRLLKRIEDRFEMLGRQPLIGEPRDDLRAGLRGFPVGNYVILYDIVDSLPRIVRVMHAARDIEGMFRQDLE
jgi:toxin ParE1/3/4